MPIALHLFKKLLFFPVRVSVKHKKSWQKFIHILGFQCRIEFLPKSCARFPANFLNLFTKVTRVKHEVYLQCSQVNLSESIHCQIDVK